MAQSFHEHHRRLSAAQAGLDATPWEDFSSSDRQLWIAAASRVLDDMELANSVLESVG